MQLSIGQWSDKGRKDANQDFHGALIPDGHARFAKGVAVILADGISSSSVGRTAAEAAVKSFLTDYYCTSDTWSVKTSAHRVIAATNSWLYAQTRRGQSPCDRDKGYVCTLALAIFKSRTAHLFNVGDSRIYRLAGSGLEQLTEDHRISISSAESYLARALGVGPQIEVDYRAEVLDAGDTFVLCTDGVHEFVGGKAIAEIIRRLPDHLDEAAHAIVAAALANGSDDNLTVQIVRVDSLPHGDAHELLESLASLPLPPVLEAPATLDGYRILRKLHGSSRSHLYLASDPQTAQHVAIKTLSIDLASDPQAVKRFMLEEWVARRLSNPHVLKSVALLRPRAFLYNVSEYVEGQTLEQWIFDHPSPDLETVRAIIDQIAKGLQAFHRLEMLHQDLRPANIMIDRHGTVKIIDFGAVSVAGVMEMAPEPQERAVLGTMQYAAPEYFLGDSGTTRSDIYSLGVVAYQMLTGRLPYGTKMAAAGTALKQRRVPYDSIQNHNPSIPSWVDDVVRKAVYPDPRRRFSEPLEFAYALRNPLVSESSRRKPLAEQNPLLLWRLISLALAIVVIVLLAGRR